MSLHELIEWAVELLRTYQVLLVLGASLVLAYFAWPRSREERQAQARRRRRDAEDRTLLRRARDEAIRYLLKSRD